MHYWEEIQALISFKCARKCMISYMYNIQIFPVVIPRDPRGGTRRPPPAPTPAQGRGKHLPDQDTDHPNRRPCLS